MNVVHNQPASTQSLINYGEELRLKVHELYAAGLNVWPLPYGEKRPVMPNHATLVWKQLGLHLWRLEPNELNATFAGLANVACSVGVSSGNLFVIDCETPAAGRYHIQQARRRGIPIWASRTPRGIHLYLRCAEGELQNLPAYNPTTPNRHQCMRDCEIKAHTGYVVAPPSRKLDGKAYRWITREGPTPPTISIKQLDWLIDADGKPLKPKLRVKRKRKRQTYHPDTETFLASGAPIGTRNQSLFKAAVNLHNSGGDVFHLQSIAQATGLPDSEIKATLKSAQKPRYTNPKSSGSKQYLPHWQRALIFISHYDGFKGKSGASDRAVFLAMTECCKRSGYNGDFRGSARELAELAHLTVKTTLTALKRLQGSPHVKHSHPSPLIIKTRQDDMGTNYWKFSPVITSLENNDFSGITPLGCYASTVDRGVVIARKDNAALERGAVRFEGMAVYNALRAADGLTTAEVAQVTNLSLSVVYRILHRDAPLCDFRLVERFNGRWIAHDADDQTWYEIALKFGGSVYYENAYEKNKTRLKRHQGERQRRIFNRIFRWRSHHDDYFPWKPRRETKKLPAPSPLLFADVKVVLLDLKMDVDYPMRC